MLYKVSAPDKCLSERASDFKISRTSTFVLMNFEPYSDFTVLYLQTSAFIVHSNNTKTTTKILVFTILPYI